MRHQVGNLFSNGCGKKLVFYLQLFLNCNFKIVKDYQFCLKVISGGEKNKQEGSNRKEFKVHMLRMFLMCIYLFILRERKRESAIKGGVEWQGDRNNPKQREISELSLQSLMQGSNSWTVRSRVRSLTNWATQVPPYAVFFTNKIQNLNAICWKK